MRSHIKKKRVLSERDQGILRLYTSGQFMTQKIAKIYGVSTRVVQRVAYREGVSRSVAEANKAMAKFKDYSGHRTPADLKVKRTQLTLKKRLQVILAHPYCVICGNTPQETGIRLEVDHIDNNPRNNIDSNLQVLCNRCNLGKSHIARFGA